MTVADRGLDAPRPVPQPIQQGSSAPVAAPPVGASPGLRLPAMFRALRHRDFRLLWLGLIVSQSGNWMQMVALGWLVYLLTESAFYLGLVGFARAVPVILFTLWGGVLADRVDRRRVMLAAQTANMLLAFLLAVLAASPYIQVWHTILIAFLMAAGFAFEVPSRQSLVPQLVDRRDVVNAIGLQSAAFNAAGVVGPALAGLVIAWVGVSAAFFLNGLSFLGVIAALLLMQPTPAASVRRGGMLATLLEGLDYVRRTPAVLALIVMIMVISLFSRPYLQLMPVFARDILQVGAAGLGTLTASVGVGALFGALSVAAFGSFRKRGRLLLVGAMVFAVALIAFTLSREYALSVSLAGLMGFANTFYMASTNTMLQTNAPDGLRGRVISVYTMITMGFMPLGTLLMGSLGSLLGVPLALALGAGLSLAVVAAVAAGVPKIRALE